MTRRFTDRDGVERRVGPLRDIEFHDRGSETLERLDRAEVGARLSR